MDARPFGRDQGTAFGPTQPIGEAKQDEQQTGDDQGVHLSAFLVARNRGQAAGRSRRPAKAWLTYCAAWKAARASAVTSAGCGMRPAASRMPPWPETPSDRKYSV